MEVVLKPVYGLITAAGLSSRMGAHKPLMRILDVTVIERILQTFEAAGITHSCVVIGYHGEAIRRQLAGYDVEFAENKEYRTTTMFASVKAGLTQIKDRCSRVVFCPVDIPMVQADTLRQLLKNPAAVVKPIYHGRGGHPIVIHESCFARILAHDGEGGLRQALYDLPRPAAYELVEDPGTVMDADTPEDFAVMEEYARELARKSRPVTAGVILATGYNSQGEQIDPMQQLGSTSIVRRQVLTMQLAGISPILLLSGWDRLRVENHLNKHELLFFQMEDFTKKDLRADVLPVLEYLMDKCTQMVYAPADYPLLRVDTLKTLMDAQGGVRCPVFSGQRGYPLVITMDAIRALDISGIEEYDSFVPFLMDRAEDICEVPVGDEGCICNISDMEHCECILKRYNQQMQHPYVRLDIDFETKVFDPRLKVLLEMIQETHSVKRACERVSMSVGMAWNYINTLEEHLGYVVVERRQGGRHGGKTSLTEQGKRYLENYTELEQRVREFASAEFAKLFSGEIS